MVEAEVMEAHIGAYVANMHLPLEYVEAIVGELRQRYQPNDNSEEIHKTKRAIDRWRRLFVTGDIDETRYKREAAPHRRRLENLEKQTGPQEVEEAMRYIRSMGSLFSASERGIQREFIREVFDEIFVEGPQIISITLKPGYAPFFEIDRAERFGSDVGVVWLPDEVPGLEPLKTLRSADLSPQAIGYWRLLSSAHDRIVQVCRRATSFG